MPKRKRRNVSEDNDPIEELVNSLANVESEINNACAAKECTRRNQSSREDGEVKQSAACIPHKTMR